MRYLQEVMRYRRETFTNDLGLRARCAGSERELYYYKQGRRECTPTKAASDKHLVALPRRRGLEKVLWLSLMWLGLMDVLFSVVKVSLP